MSDQATLWLVAGATLFVAAMFFAMAQMGTTRTEHPSMILGIRTAATTRSPEHWYQAHRAARPHNLLGAVTVALCVPLMFAVGTAADPVLGLRVGSLAVALNLVVFGALAVVKAVRAAREVDSAQRADQTAA